MLRVNSVKEFTLYLLIMEYGSTTYDTIIKLVVYEKKNYHFVETFYKLKAALI